MKALFISKSQAQVKSTIIEFDSIADAKRNGYNCNNRNFQKDVAEKFIIEEYFEGVEGIEELRTLVKTDSECRIFSADMDFIESVSRYVGADENNLSAIYQNFDRIIELDK